ncbi:unnamed protein product [Dibothriocephalus latus]|uniref:Reverse transcriptase domain-containing protein n=1 Tax=Dibothriocephalus latus TaxID=60516 RepID=A0A3P6QTS3_DIBLA|nr:unnamed protein product [Dibothriocephalus latus]
MRLRISIAYRNDGHCPNNQRIQAPMRVFTTTVCDLLFVDDCSLKIATDEDMQSNTRIFDADCAISGLIINTDNAVFM